MLTGNATGAADPASAVRGFMAAVKATDLQAMGAIWGDVQGPARDALPRDELEKREFIMMCSLRHDHFEILPDAPGRNGSRTVPVRSRSARSRARRRSRWSGRQARVEERRRARRTEARIGHLKPSRAHGNDGPSKSIESFGPTPVTAVMDLELIWRTPYMHSLAARVRPRLRPR